ncbi:MAG: dockerin type I repeat-containing protein, partial [Oscillospiraceae bacterium]|nr:dockerin type I repeat-containing protein [Oscillospiraceae bacterium]
MFYRLTDTEINLKTGETLHLEFEGMSNLKVYIQVQDKNYHVIDDFKVNYPDENHKINFYYTAKADYSDLKILTLTDYGNYIDVVSYDIISAPQVTDVVLLYKYLHGKQTITQEQFTKLDRNHDNLVNIYDFVLLKKELISGSGENTSQLQVKTKIDMTSAVNNSAWESATSNESYVIKSVQELNEIINPMFHAGVIRGLNQIYDEVFFENNVLLLDLEPLEYNTKFTLAIAGCAYNSKNQLEVLYEKMPVNAHSGQKIAIGQVAIPKNQYHDNEVVWNQKYTNANTIDKPIDFAYKTDELINDLLSTADFEGSAFITTYDELTEFLGKYLKEERLAEYQALYSDEFFETKSVYLKIDGRIDSNFKVWRVTERIAEDNQKHISIDCKEDEEYGCEIFLYLNQVIIDKIEKSCAIEETNISIPIDNSFDGEVYYYDAPRTFWETKNFNAIAVNIYQFADAKEIAIYKTSPAGLNLYGHHELLESFIYTGEENIFEHGYAIETDENGNYIGKDFSIYFDEEKIIVDYTC